MSEKGSRGNEPIRSLKGLHIIPHKEKTISGKDGMLTELYSKLRCDEITKGFQIFSSVALVCFLTARGIIV